MAVPSPSHDRLTSIEDAKPVKRVKRNEVSGNTAITPKLDCLPEELLGNISIKLGSDDLFNLRLCCRAVEAKTRHEWASEYFSAKCFMFTTESLKVLDAIASCEKLRGYLHHVYIIRASIREGILCDCTPNLRQREAHTHYSRDQQNLRATGGDKLYMTNAFSKLPALWSLSLIDNLQFLPGNAACHGLNKFQRTTRSKPLFAPWDEHNAIGYFTWLSHCWRMMMQAVAESGITTITKLEVLSAVPGQPSTTGLSPMDLDFPQPVLEKLAVAFSKLDTLDLTLRSQTLRPGEPESADDPSRATKLLKLFCGAIQSTKRLSIAMDGTDLTRPLFRALARKFDPANITNLTLSNIRLDTPTLAAFLSKLKSVQFVDFAFLHLVDDLVEGSCRWVSILKVLIKRPKLGHLHLRYLHQAGSKVFFLKKLEDGYGDDSDWEDAMASGDIEIPEPLPQSPGAHLEDDVVTDLQLKKTCPFKTKDYKAPCFAGRKERGYFICLEGADEIKAKLPRFIAECNTSNGFHLDLNNLNNIMHSIFSNPLFVPQPVGVGAPAGNSNTTATATANPGQGGTVHSTLLSLLSPGLAQYGGHSATVTLSGALFGGSAGPAPPAAAPGQGQAPTLATLAPHTTNAEGDGLMTEEDS